jgi:hypothetical protein
MPQFFGFGHIKTQTNFGNKKAPINFFMGAFAYSASVVLLFVASKT